MSRRYDNMFLEADEVVQMPQPRVFHPGLKNSFDPAVAQQLASTYSDTPFSNTPFSQQQGFSSLKSVAIARNQARPTSNAATMRKSHSMQAPKGIMIWENDVFESDVLSPAGGASPAASARSSVNGSQYSSNSPNGLSGSSGNVILNAHSRQSSLAPTASQQWGAGLDSVSESSASEERMEPRQPGHQIVVVAPRGRQVKFSVTEILPDASEEARASVQPEANDARLQAIRWNAQLRTPEAHAEEVRKLLLAGNRNQAVHLVAPKEGLVRCFIRRDMGLFGLGRSYEMRTEERHMFLLSASEWQCDKGSSLRISQTIDGRTDKGAAQLNVSHSGMEYSLYGESRPMGQEQLDPTRCGPGIRIQVAKDMKPYGLTVTVPLPDDVRLSNQLDLGSRQCLDNGRITDVAVLVKRMPLSNRRQHEYIGRVPVKSNKNFQLVYWNEVDTPEAQVMLQVSKVSDSTYALDFAYPFTAETAFAVALAAMVNRIGQ